MDEEELDTFIKKVLQKPSVNNTKCDTLNWRGIVDLGFNDAIVKTVMHHKGDSENDGRMTVIGGINLRPQQSTGSQLQSNIVFSSI